MNVAAVVIGRNEGPRLKTCLASLAGTATPIVYVDSGSTDGSVALATDMGVHVVELDNSTPFTAARARNTGYAKLLELSPDVRSIQFVDADCELNAGWIETAALFLDSRPDVGAVCGRLRERHPEETIYNTLCDIEWDARPGEVDACGGIAMVRSSAFNFVSGYEPSLIAGEEPEMCLRMRRSGWRIWRLDSDMALHDAAIERFSQWWTRMKRGGYAYATGAVMHGFSPERYCIRESVSIWLWGLAIPLVAILAAYLWSPWALGLLLIYPAQIARIASTGRRSSRENWLYALFVLIGKFPGMAGQAQFLAHKCGRRSPRIIEYK